MKNIFLGLLFLSLNVYAEADNVELKIISKTKKNEPSTMTSINAVLGKELTIPNLNLKIKVTEVKTFAEPDAPIDLKFEMKIFGVKNGQKQLLSSPQVMTVMGKEAVVTMTNPSAAFLQLAVLPVKLTAQ